MTDLLNFVHTTLGRLPIAFFSSDCHRLLHIAQIDEAPDKTMGNAVALGQFVGPAARAGFAPGDVILSVEPAAWRPAAILNTSSSSLILAFLADPGAIVGYFRSR